MSNFREIDLAEPSPPTIGTVIGLVDGQPFTVTVSEPAKLARFPYYTQLRNVDTGEIFQGPDIESIEPVPGGFKFKAATLTFTTSIVIDARVALLRTDGKVVTATTTNEGPTHGCAGEQMTLTFNLAIAGFKFSTHAEITDFWVKHRERT